MSAIEKETENKAWERWIVDYQISSMQGQKFMSFNDYLKKIKKPAVKQVYTKMTEEEKLKLKKQAEELKDKKPIKVIKD